MKLFNLGGQRVESEAIACLLAEDDEVTVCHEQGGLAVVQRWHVTLTGLCHPPPSPPPVFESILLGRPVTFSDNILRDFFMGPYSGCPETIDDI